MDEGGGGQQMSNTHSPCTVHETQYLAHFLHGGFVGRQLSLKCLVLLQLAYEVRRVLVGLVTRRLHFLVDPLLHLNSRQKSETSTL